MNDWFWDETNSSTDISVGAVRRRCHVACVDLTFRKKVAVLLSYERDPDKEGINIITTCNNDNFLRRLLTFSFYVFFQTMDACLWTKKVRAHMGKSKTFQWAGLKHLRLSTEEEEVILLLLEGPRQLVKTSFSAEEFAHVYKINYFRSSLIRNNVRSFFSCFLLVSLF